MFSHLGVFRRSILEKINGFRKGREGSQDYDLTLRSLPHTTPERIRHIPKILYHWRAIEGSTARGIDAKMYAFEAARKVIGEYVESTNPGAKMQNSTISVHHRVVWPVPNPAPLVSIIIPTKNGMEILKRAVDSILEKTTYSNYEIMIVNNQSDDPATISYFKEIVKNPKVHVMDYNKPFNYAAINNEAVKAVKGEVICLLNNDTEVISPDWLTEMVGQALRKDVGAVGAKLYFPDNTIQHGGVVLGGGYFKGTVARHFLIRMPRNTQGYFGRAQLVHDVSAVTAACLVTRREIYQRVGGMDEKELKVAYNDIDFCLRLRQKGLLIVWTPYAELYHHESATRGKDDTAERIEHLNGEAAVVRMRWSAQLREDPYYSPNLDMIRANFELAFPPRVEKPWQSYEKLEKKKAA